MPCYVDPSYIESSERDQNERLLGKRWTDKEAAINVACAYAARVRHGAPLPDWATKWAGIHEERDSEMNADRDANKSGS